MMKPDKVVNTLIALHNGYPLEFYYKYTDVWLELKDRDEKKVLKSIKSGTLFRVRQKI